MNKIWLTSDLHFCHDRDFIYKPRGFDSVHEMNEQIIKNFNEVMDWDDELYILGDCFLNDNKEGMSYMRQLPGKKHIIWGNHCTIARQELMWLENFDCLGYANTLKYNGYHFFLCHYPTMTSNFDTNKPLKTRILSLSGHTHAKNIWDAAGGYNVALDAHNCYPVEINEIIEAFKEHRT